MPQPLLFPPPVFPWKRCGVTKDGKPLGWHAQGTRTGRSWRACAHVWLNRSAIYSSNNEPYSIPWNGCTWPWIKSSSIPYMGSPEGLRHFCVFRRREFGPQGPRRVAAQREFFEITVSPRFPDFWSSILNFKRDWLAAAISVLSTRSTHRQVTRQWYKREFRQYRTEFGCRRGVWSVYFRTKPKSADRRNLSRSRPTAFPCLGCGQSLRPSLAPNHFWSPNYNPFSLTLTPRPFPPFAELNVVCSWVCSGWSVSMLVHRWRGTVRSMGFKL